VMVSEWWTNFFLSLISRGEKTVGKLKEEERGGGGSGDIHDVTEPVDVCAFHGINLEKVVALQSDAGPECFRVLLGPDLLGLLDDCRAVLNNELEIGEAPGELEGEATYARSFVRSLSCPLMSPEEGRREEQSRLTNTTTDIYDSSIAQRLPRVIYELSAHNIPLQGRKNFLM